jgi:5-amino-6-(5-phosphoribosylamino)uracil reductase
MNLIHVSAAMSLDGRIDDRSAQRLVLSSQEDLDDMHKDRANCDAILIGANTIRRDNPSLLFHSQELIAQRIKRGQTAELIKVTITNSGDIDPSASFFSRGNTPKLVICPTASSKKVSDKLSRVATILPIQEVTAGNIVHTLKIAGINSLFVEGGTSLLTMFLSQGIFHRFRLAIAPFFVGDNLAPSLIGDAVFTNNANNRLRIASMRNLGNMIVVDLINEAYNDG